MKVLVTGAAGFVGYHVSAALLARGDAVIGVDDLNPYYDVALKEARLARLAADDGFTFHKLDIAERGALAAVCLGAGIDRIVHLAAQAGVRHSLEDPYTYVDTNIMGQVVMLEACRLLPRLDHLVYASSSSVYGGNRKLPFAVADRVDHPVSLYAASKRAQELVSECYADLHGLAQTGLRFFTVYGPWGRPDMAVYTFTKAILGARPIRLFNKGDMKRDFTYIDDIVAGVLLCLDRPPLADPHWKDFNRDPSRSSAPWRVYNIGRGEPVGLLHYIDLMEQALGQTTEHEMLPAQPGDVAETFADIEALVRDTGYAPLTSLELGLEQFANWYRDYYHKK